MVPEEWPVAAEPADRMVDSAHVRGPSRLTTVRRDFFLDPSERLTEQERALMTAMLHDLVAALAAAIRAAVGGKTPEPEPSKIAATLGRAGLLDRRHSHRFRRSRRAAPPASTAQTGQRPRS